MFGNLSGSLNPLGQLCLPTDKGGSQAPQKSVATDLCYFMQISYKGRLRRGELFYKTATSKEGRKPKMLQNEHKEMASRSSKKATSPTSGRHGREK